MILGAEVIIDGPMLGGIGTLLGGAVALLTWWLMKKDQRTGAASTLVEDALKLQKAAHEAYEQAQEEMDELREEVAELRGEVAEIRSEMDHWKTVAKEARKAYTEAGCGEMPPWWKPYVPETA